MQEPDEQNMKQKFEICETKFEEVGKGPTRLHAFAC